MLASINIAILLIIFQVFLMLIFGSVARRVFSERSSQDSGYSIMAQQVMQTAMKLPSHILPTLDELEPSRGGGNYRDKNIGVYVPHKKRTVGIYVPKLNSQKNKPSSNLNINRPKGVRQSRPLNRPPPKVLQLTPNRHKRKLPPGKPPGKSPGQSPGKHPRKPTGKPEGVPHTHKPRPIFTVSLDPHSPLGKLYDFSQTGKFIKNKRDQSIIA